MKTIKLPSVKSICIAFAILACATIALDGWESTLTDGGCKYEQM